MSTEPDDAQGREETTPLGRQVGAQPDRWAAPSEADRSGAGATAAGASPADGFPASGYGPDAQHGQAVGSGPHGQYGQPTYGQPTYGQPTYGQPTYGQPTYGQPTYGQYGQPQYSQPYGQSPYDLAQPARPGTVISAAVLGIVHGALGVLVTVLFFAFGALIDDLVDAIADSDPSVDTAPVSDSIDDVRAVFVAVGLVALAWAVVMVWGSVLALRGRSRVLLLVGSAISVAATGLVFLLGLFGLVANPGADGQAGGIFFLLVFFLASLAMLVLLCVRSAGQYFAAHRQRRALVPR